MAKIENTTVYPLTTPSVDDFIIGTDTSDENRTVSFSIESITATSLLQGLQSVLDTQNFATEDISLTGNITLVGGYIYPTQILAGGASGTAGQLLSSTGTGIQWVDTSVIASNTLQEVTTAGNTTTDNIVMSGGDLNTTGSINMSGAAQVLALSTNTDMTLAAGCDITTSGNINLSGGSSVLNFGTTAEINDSAGSTGAIGSILTVDAAGTGVEWSTGIPTASMPTLQEVLDAGNTATGIGMQFIGSSITTFSASSTIQSFASNVWSGTNEFSGNGGTPATSGINLPGSLSDGSGTGTSGQVLTSTATGISWADLSTVGVSSVSTTPPIVAAFPLAPITIAPGVGAVIVRQNIYDGGSLIGCVPAGGTAGTFLEGNGNWTTPTGAVTSVSVLASGTSTGLTDAIKITPTTGLVQVQSNAFGGGDAVGHVPDATGNTANFLKGDGTWAAAGGAAAAPEGYLPYLLGVAKTAFTSGNYHTLALNNTNTTGDRTVFSTDLGASSPAVMAGTMTDIQHIAGCFLYNPRTNACSSAFPNMKVCDFEMQFLSEFGSHAWDVELWKTSQCSTGTYTLAGSYQFPTVVADTLYCGTIVWVSSALQTLLPGEAFFITLRTNGTLAAADVTLNIVARWQGAV
jgi:hypothetical protein